MNRTTSESASPDYILASYPRSANHWVRYIVEFLSKQPTLGEGNRNRDRKDPPVFQRLEGEEYYESMQPIAIKRHSIRDTDDRSMKMIFVIRDYREVIKRHLAKPFSIFRIAGIEQNVRMYLDLIHHYQTWPSSKLLVRYEDLVEHPHRTIAKISNFIEKENLLEDFLSDLEIHQERCVKMYDNYTGSVTKGKKVNHFSSQYGQGWKRYLDWRIKKSYDGLFL